MTTTNRAVRHPTPGPAASTIGEALTSVREVLRRVPWLNVNLSMFHTVVGLTTGLLSIFGALFAIPGYFTPAAGKGQVIAVVVDAKTDDAVSNATVEILTVNNAVVTTLHSSASGKANYTLDEGQYQVRVRHPKFGAEVRHVQVASGQRAEIQIRLRSGTAAPLREAERVINEGVDAVKRLFRD